MTRGRTPVLFAFAAGVLIRAAALPLPGAGDVEAWKVWSYHAVTDGVTRLYGTGSPPQYTEFAFHDQVAPVNYPPLGLYELGAVGWLYSLATRGRFPDTVAFTVVLKALPVLFEVGIVATLFVALRRTSGADQARWATMAYWLNPAAIACASVGGYIDTLPALPAVGALVAAVAGAPAVAGGLAACAVLTKPQGVFVLPAVFLAVWNAGDSRHAVRSKGAIACALGGLVVSAIILAPMVAAGVWPNMIRMLRTLLDDGSVSMSAYNFWWVAGHAMNAAYATMRGASLWTAVTAPVVYVPFDRAAAHGLGHLRETGTLLTVAGIGWGLWIGRRARDLPLVAAVAGFSVYVYSMLATRVHENHAFLAIPLLVAAAAGRRRFVPVLAAVSTWFTLNLVFYGVASDDGRFAVPHMLTVVDTTLLLAVFGCASLFWFASVLTSECQSSETPTPRSANASDAVRGIVSV